MEGVSEVTGNRETLSGKGRYTAENANLVVNMSSLTSGNTITASGVGELSFMTITEVFNEQETSEWD